MRLALVRKLTIFCLLFWFAGVQAAAADPQVFFNPPLPGDRLLNDYMAAQIDCAQKELLIQQYQFPRPDVLAAILRAKQRGVAITVIFDNTAYRDPGTAQLKSAGIPVYRDPRVIAHNKVMIGDATWVLGGSFNPTAHAIRNNNENLTIEDRPELVQRYIQNFQARLAACRHE
jgi:phosphatidylserine/phosphatidylglycerophosphate/cardiolipin synthase-like enzyme